LLLRVLHLLLAVVLDFRSLIGGAMAAASARPERRTKPHRPAARVCWYFMIWVVRSCLPGNAGEGLSRGRGWWSALTPANAAGPSGRSPCAGRFPGR
jgi:hypothetical protein